MRYGGVATALTGWQRSSLAYSRLVERTFARQLSTKPAEIFMIMCICYRKWPVLVRLVIAGLVLVAVRQTAWGATLLGTGR